MKGRVRAWALCLALLFVCLTGCDTGVPEASSAPLSTTAAASIPEAPAAGAEIAMLVTEATAESPYGQGVWATVSRVAGECAATSGLYRAAGQGDDKAALAALELAVKGGARLVVMLGEDLAGITSRVSSHYPDIDFILLDMPYGTAVSSNTVLVRYSPEQSGWLAGYAGVYEELGNIGFVAPQDEEAQRYTLGFLLGADAAAQDRKAAESSLQAWPLEPAEAEANWEGQFLELYQPDGPGAHTVFTSLPTFVPSLLSAAKAANGYVAGLENTMPHPLPEEVLSCVHYDPQNILSALLEGWLDGRFPGGETLEGTVAGGEIGLILPKEGLGRFSEQRYQTVLDRFRIGNLATQIALRTAPDKEGNRPTPESLGLEVFTIGGPAPVQPVSGPASAPESTAPEAPTPHTPAPPPENTPPEPPPAQESNSMPG